MSQQLEEKSIHDLKKQLRVQFLGEEGVDEGGVQKEFFQLIVRELFDSKYGMFSFNEESRLCWFSPNPMVDMTHIREYKLVGLLLGLAVYNSVILDLHFPRALYKKMMNVDIDITDLKQLDPVRILLCLYMNVNGS
jgi:ubiquitin-protein ligase E3 A